MHAPAAGPSQVIEVARNSSKGNAQQTTRTSSRTEGGTSLSLWWRRQQVANGGRVRPDADVVTKLTDELDKIVFGLLPRDHQLAEKADFLRLLQEQLTGVIDGAQVAAFGSAVNGLWTPQSDVDVCIRVPGSNTRNAQIQALRKVAAELNKCSSHYMEPRFGAQVPILHWAPRMPGGVACDISVNNILAVANSRLLGRYVRFDNRMRTLGFCVKAWASARGINDRSKGTMSSFSLVLMVVNFLQRRDPPILPSFQDIAFSRSMPAVYISGVDTRYCTDPVEVEKEMTYLRNGKLPNDESVGFLLFEFFRHYAHEYKRGTIRIRDTRSVLPPETELGPFLQIDNPFEVGKDVANVDSSQHDVIRKEFRRAFGMLSQGRSFRELLTSPSGDDDDVFPQTAANRRRQY